MRIAVLTDVNGNAEALEAVLRDADARGVHLIFAVGDVVGLGPDTVEPLRPDDRGASMLAKLIGARARDVYATALSDWPSEKQAPVHDVRVAARRLREALALAAPLLEQHRSKRATRRVRRLHSALGARRSADALLDEVEALEETLGRSAKALSKKLERDQRRATKSLAKEFPPERLLRHGVSMLATIMHADSDSTTTLGFLGALHLERRLQEVEALLPLLDDDADREGHHRLRIAVKRLRDSTGILAEAFPELIAEAETLAPLHELQRCLGRLHDCDALIELAGEARAEDLRKVRRARHTEAQASATANARTLISALRGAASEMAQPRGSESRQEM